MGIVVTVGLISAFGHASFDPTKIAKLASAFMLVMFAFACLAVDRDARESVSNRTIPVSDRRSIRALQILGILGTVLG